jgi:hypothetical protein
MQFPLENVVQYTARGPFLWLGNQTSQRQAFY